MADILPIYESAISNRIMGWRYWYGDGKSIDFSDGEIKGILLDALGQRYGERTRYPAQPGVTID